MVNTVPAKHQHVSIVILSMLGSVVLDVMLLLFGLQEHNILQYREMITRASAKWWN